ncbi:MAG: hypothetical protein ACE5FZ_01635 [Nitrospiria bacterium]
MRLFSLALFVSLLAEPSDLVEKVQFYDWKSDVVSKQERNTCVIHFTGITQSRIVLSMNLSVVEEKSSEGEALYITMIKVSAGRIHKIDLSDVTPIKIQNAWVKTSAGSSEGKVNKINDGPNPYFLAGTEGFDLFRTLVRGIAEEGVVVRFEEGPDMQMVVQVPAPALEITEKLRACATIKI